MEEHQENQEQKIQFYRLLEEHVKDLGLSKQGSFCITQDTYDKALQAIQLPKGMKCPEGSQFKFWALKNFKLQEIGYKKILYCKKTSSPVVPKEDIFGIIKHCHLRVGHSGRDKTWEEIKSNYSGIRHDIIPLFLRTCTECSTRVPMKKPPAGKPIISLGYMTRMHIDLIDMTSRPDHDYKWILHMQDHFSKFNWTHPLTSKHAAEVAEKLVQTFCLFGAPHILQSDNGKEFVAEVINELNEKWPGLVIIHSQPRHPQSQSSVEIGNKDLQLKLGKWLEEHPKKGWAESLHYITYAINTSVSATTRKSPYEVVFGQSPRTLCAELEILSYQGIKHEEDATDFFTGTGIWPQLMTQSEPAIDQTAVSSLPGPSISLQPLNQPEASTSQGNTVESAKTREVPAKRGREYYLLHGARIVAVGMEFFNEEVVHGQTIDPQHQGAFQVTSVIDQDFIPTSGKPFEEPLSEGQLVIWELASTTPVELLDTPHSKVRKIATDNYLKAANRQEVNFDAKAKSLVKTDSIGDTVGISVNKVDWTNTDP